MPLNPNIALIPSQGVQAQGSAIDNMFNTYYKSAGNARQNALLDLQTQGQAFSQDIQADANSRTNEAHSLNQEAGQFKLDQAQGHQVYRALEGLGKLDPETRRAQIEFMMPELSKFGFDADDVDMLMNDHGQAMSIMEQYKPDSASDISLEQKQFNELTEIIKPALDENGNFDPSRANAAQKAAAVKLRITPPATGSAAITTATTDGLTDLVGDSEASISGKTAGSTENAKVTAKGNADLRNSTISAGTAAKGMITTTKKLLNLNRLITTGKTAAARKYMGDLFGVTDPDLGTYNALAGKLVLDNIRSLGANPTEGERAFLLQITPSISQGGAVNESILKDMLTVQERQVERARWAVKNPNKNIEEYLLLEDDFAPQSADAEPTINEDDAALDWAKSNPDDPRSAQILNSLGAQ